MRVKLYMWAFWPAVSWAITLCPALLTILGCPPAVRRRSSLLRICGTPDRVELGRLLFYDKRLSGDETMSCASCHRQEFAFSDRKVRPRGIAHGSFPSGELHPRNSQHLSNVAYNISLTWANSTQLTLESQAAGPLFAEEGPSTIVELGFNSSQLEKIKADIRQRRPTRLRPERFSIITDSIQKQNTPQNPCGNAVSLT